MHASKLLCQCCYADSISKQFYFNSWLWFYSHHKGWTKGIFQPLDQGTIKSFKHEYCKQHLTKIISMTDHQKLHDKTLMEINVSDAPHFLAESWCCDTHTHVHMPLHNPPNTHTHTHTCMPMPTRTQVHTAHAYIWRSRTIFRKASHTHTYDHELFSEKWTEFKLNQWWRRCNKT